MKQREDELPALQLKTRRLNELNAQIGHCGRTATGATTEGRADKE
jgi:hypothetical protein